jgi:hypothetical protein
MQTDIQFVLYLAQFFLEWKMFQKKYCRRNQNTRFVFRNFYFCCRKSCRFEMTWKNIVEWSRPQMRVWRMRIACWIPKATNAHTQYAILIACPLQKCLQERASLLCYTYIVWIVNKMYIHVHSNNLTGVQCNITLQVFSPTQLYRCSVQQNITGVQSNTTLQVFSPTQPYRCSVQHNITGVQSNTTLQVFSAT